MPSQGKERVKPENKFVLNFNGLRFMNVALDVVVRRRAESFARSLARTNIVNAQT
jgi:hypothetical protein